MGLESGTILFVVVIVNVVVIPSKVVLFEHVIFSRSPNWSTQATIQSSGAHGGLRVHIGVHKLSELFVVRAPVIQRSRFCSSSSSSSSSSDDEMEKRGKKRNNHTMLKGTGCRRMRSLDRIGQKARIYIQ